MHSFLSKIIPFVLLGIAIVAFAFGLVLLFYLFVLGAAVGLILFAVTWIRDKFFSSKHLTKHKNSTKQGRVIDHIDHKE